MRHTQFSQFGNDITGSPYAAEDCDTVCVWDEDGTLIVCLGSDDTDVWSTESGQLVDAYGTRPGALDLAERVAAGGDLRCADCIGVFGPAVMGTTCGPCRRETV